MSLGRLLATPSGRRRDPIFCGFHPSELPKWTPRHLVPVPTRVRQAASWSPTDERHKRVNGVHQGRKKGFFFKRSTQVLLVDPGPTFSCPIQHPLTSSPALLPPFGIPSSLTISLILCVFQGWKTNSGQGSTTRQPLSWQKLAERKHSPSCCGDPGGGRQFCEAMPSLLGVARFPRQNRHFTSRQVGPPSFLGGSVVTPSTSSCQATSLGAALVFFQPCQKRRVQEMENGHRDMIIANLTHANNWTNTIIS